MAKVGDTKEYIKECHEKIDKLTQQRDELEQRDMIMVEALAEIKALTDNPKKYYEQHETNQTVEDIINSCIDELAKVPYVFTPG